MPADLARRAPRPCQLSPQTLPAMPADCGGTAVKPIGRFLERLERLALMDTGIDPIAPGEPGEAERAGIGKFGR